MLCICMTWLIAFHLHDVNANQGQELKKLQDNFSEWRLRRLPEYATTIGVNRYNDVLEDYHWNSFQEEKRILLRSKPTIVGTCLFPMDYYEDERTDDFLEGLKKIDYDSLNSESRTDYDVFNDTLQTFLLNYKWKDYNALNPVSFLEGPHINPELLISSTPFFTQGDYVNFIARLEGFPKQVEDAIGRMNRSIQFRHTYYNTSVLKVPELIDKIVSIRPEDSLFYKPFIHRNDNNTSIHHSINSRYHLKQDALTAISEYMSSLRMLKNYMKEIYLKHTRSGPGVNSWDNGEEFYRACLRWHLSLDMTPEEVHQKGLNEVTRISAQMNTILRKLNHYGSVKEFFDNIKHDPRFTLNTSEQVMNRFKDIVQRQILEKLPLLFKDLPNLPVVLINSGQQDRIYMRNRTGNIDNSRLADMRIWNTKIQNIEPTPTDGPSMYSSGPADGSRPGTFYLNLFRPRERITIDFMALSLHESSPGHHLQGSYASTVQNLPFYRKFTMSTVEFPAPTMFPYYTAYIEGWALYAEALGEELNLYKNDYDLMGRYGSEIFRASRLVVDTGLHHYNWSREKAIEFMLNYTAYSRAFITNEIDRYLTWPGQACAYKIGELKIRELRTKAEKELGKRFDIKEFHLVILKNGAMPLRLLERLVYQWINSVKKSPYSDPSATCQGSCNDLKTSVIISSFLILMVNRLYQR